MNRVNVVDLVVDLVDVDIDVDLVDVDLLASFWVPFWERFGMRKLTKTHFCQTLTILKRIIQNPSDKPTLMWSGEPI